MQSCVLTGNLLGNRTLSDVDLNFFSRGRPLPGDQLKFEELNRQKKKKKKTDFFLIQVETQIAVEDFLRSLCIWVFTTELHTIALRMCPKH